MDFLRLAFLSLALERQDERSAATATWESALKAAEARPELLERLARVTGLWGWKERTEQVLWKLGPSESGSRWAMDYLWAAAMARGDTPKLYEVSKLRLKMQPDSAATRNNHLNLALLAGQGSATTVQLAEALFKENPSNVFIASTYGFALYQEGKARAAASIMQEFKPEELSDRQWPNITGSFWRPLARPSAPVCRTRDQGGAASRGEKPGRVLRCRVPRPLAPPLPATTRPRRRLGTKRSPSREVIRIN